jgi:hypothetical protein
VSQVGPLALKLYLSTAPLIFNVTQKFHTGTRLILKQRILHRP